MDRRMVSRLSDKIRNLLMDERVTVRMPNSNIWVTGIVVSVLQYFDVIRSDGYQIRYSSNHGWQVELFPASPDYIRPPGGGVYPPESPQPVQRVVRPY
ncbi:hypothetical protein K523DRAFT_305759 [Schizophyllum commune Tattone D]|nr:hypothetical protein K525DRAFT_256331 [Schizophyllum commune Loenen D]KAI5829078.1 hypothetical protein K523DRAFT_305759 [Schizophyllum commune Tattone D]